MKAAFKHILAFALLAIAVSASKRGLGWPWNAVASDFNLFANNGQVSWVYNWEAWVPPSKPGNLEYVAMQRTADSINTLGNFMENNGAKILLGFNEPDIDSQANLSPQQAIDLWNQYILPLGNSMGLRLGSPAISNGPNGLPWLQQFMSGCGGCNVNFVVCHWYGPDINSFIQHVEAVHNAFPNMNVWVTEFALQGTPDEPTQQAFFDQAKQFLDSTDYVERYAWFGAFRGTSGNNLIDDNGNLTGLGQDYLS